MSSERSGVSFTIILDGIGFWTPQFFVSARSNDADDRVSVALYIPPNKFSTSIDVRPNPGQCQVSQIAHDKCQRGTALAAGGHAL